MIPENIQKLLESKNENDIKIGFEICRIKYPIIPLELKSFLYSKVNLQILCMYVKRNIEEHVVNKRYIGWLKEN